MKMNFSEQAKSRLMECYSVIRNLRKIETVDPEKLSKLQKIPQEFIGQLIKVKGALGKVT